MKSKDSVPILVLFGAAVCLAAPSVAFAEHMSVEVTNAKGSSVPGCEETDSCFIPHTVTIDVGSKIVWTNTDVVTHSVVSGVLADRDSGKVFNSGGFSPGQEFTHVFEEPGEYQYLCLFHPWMSGLIIVEATNGQGGDDPDMVDDKEEPAGEDAVVDYDKDRFVTTWKTKFPGDSIRIPVGDATGTYTVDWGDGSVTAQSGDALHVYEFPGTYTIQIYGDFTRIRLGSDAFTATKIQSIDQWGTIKWSTMESAFEGAVNMVNKATDTPDLSEVTDTSFMFFRAAFFNGDLSSWDVSKVTDMSYMFTYASSFNGDVSTWDVSQVTDMFIMFSGASSFNQTLNSWDVSSVTDMSRMFSHASAFNQPLDAWDVSSVTDMSQMFHGAPTFNQPINSWNVSSVTDMAQMFLFSTNFNQDLDSWDVSSVTDMHNMFAHATFFRGNVSTWDVSSVTDMNNMFAVVSFFNIDLSSWDVSSVTDMNNMFAHTPFNQPINSWDVSQVTDMSYMFLSANNFNQPLDSWDVSQVTDMSSMFWFASSFNQPLNSWDVSSVTDMSRMFNHATHFNQSLSSWDVSSVTDMLRMFDFADHFDQNLGSWYIVPDDARVNDSGVIITTISAQNDHLDGQTPSYHVAAGGDGDLFEMFGNALWFVGDEYEKPAYDITIVSTGGFAPPNSMDMTVIVDGYQ